MEVVVGRPPGRQLARELRASVVEDEALRMAADGMSVREVAAAQGVAVSTAHGRLKRGMDRLPRGNAALWRDLLDAEIAAVKEEAWRLVESRPRVVSAGRVVDVEDTVAVNGALNTILKALERQAKLRGVDAPSRQTVTVVDNRVVEEAIAEMEARLAGVVPGGEIVDAEIVDDVVPELEANGGGESEGGGDGGPGAAGEVRSTAVGVGWGEDEGAVPLVL